MGWFNTECRADFQYIEIGGDICRRQTNTLNTLLLRYWNYFLIDNRNISIKKNLFKNISWRCNCLWIVLPTTNIDSYLKGYVYVRTIMLINFFRHSSLSMVDPLKWSFIAIARIFIEMKSFDVLRRYHCLVCWLSVVSAVYSFSPRMNP
jgi:hypothetical protein